MTWDRKGTSAVTILTINTDLYLDSALHASNAGNAAHDAVSNAVSALQSSSGMAGWDGAGVDWASQYDPAARSLTSAVQDLALACSDTSRAMTMAAGEYIRAEHVASLGVSLLSHPALSPAAPEICLSSLPSAGESINPGIPPIGWDIVEGMTGVVWPNGDPNLLRSAAATWSHLANQLDELRRASIGSVRASVHSLSARDLTLLQDRSLLMDAAASDLAEDARNLATACTSYATSIEQAHEELRQEATDFVRELSMLILVGSILSFVTLGGAGAITGLIGSARVAMLISRTTAAISGLVSAAKATSIVVRATPYGTRLERLLANSAAKTPAITKPLPPAVTKFTTWTDRGTDFVTEGPLKMLGDAGKLKVEKAFWGEYASGGSWTDRAINLTGFAAAGSTLTFKSVKWGKAAYDRITAINDTSQVARQGKLPWLFQKPKNYPGLPKKLPVTVPQRLTAAHPGPAPTRRPVVTKPLLVIPGQLPPVMENPLLVQQGPTVHDRQPLIADRKLPVFDAQPMTTILPPSAPGLAVAR